MFQVFENPVTSKPSRHNSTIYHIFLTCIIEEEFTCTSLSVYIPVLVWYQGGVLESNVVTILPFTRT